MPERIPRVSCRDKQGRLAPFFNKGSKSRPRQTHEVQKGGVLTEGALVGKKVASLSSMSHEQDRPPPNRSAEKSTALPMTGNKRLINRRKANHDVGLSQQAATKASGSVQSSESM